MRPEVAIQTGLVVRFVGLQHHHGVDQVMIKCTRTSVLGLTLIGFDVTYAEVSGKPTYIYAPACTCTVTHCKGQLLLTLEVLHLYNHTYISICHL